MATPREQEDPMTTPTAQQLQINELFQAHEAMATPRAQEYPKATPTAHLPPTRLKKKSKRSYGHANSARRAYGHANSAIPH